MVDCIKPDERSVMTYVAAYYKAFASTNKVGAVGVQSGVV